MRIFTTENDIIVLHNISAIDRRRGVIYMVDGHNVKLSLEDNNNLCEVLKELHRQTCENGEESA